ncbi:hypothetical protein AKJ61_03720 [candidate division MSBL1 archaeon SCGC-AAA259B11]|nr:hypothetical protein AKJ61_03720 [candidate division MSBL1 archaeon SCGC-AAA259B11]
MVKLRIGLKGLSVSDGLIGRGPFIQARKITCRLFPEKENVGEEGPWWDKMSEEKYRVEIPKRDFERLERETKENDITVEEVIESNFFSVADLPEKWGFSSI